MFKGKKSLYLVISFLVIVFGYVGIFFVSCSSSRKGKLCTTIGEQIDYNDHYFTLESWIYSKEQKLMEVCLQVENMSFDGKDTYFTDVKDRTNKKLETEVIVNTRDFLVIRIHNVTNKFNEISLRIYYDDVTKENPLKIYTNQQDVECVEQIQDKTVEMYYVERNERKILAYEMDIESYRTEIGELESKIYNAQISIIDLESQDSYKTDSEIAEIRQKTTNIQIEISSYEKQISTLESKIAEIESRIENCKKENSQLMEKSQ